MTSLEAQLRRLSVPYTQSVLAPDRARASLLFDPKEAANLDHQTIYALAVSGLEELEGLDPVFSEYTSSLFTLSSQAWERSLQTNEVNEQLNRTLSKFLIQLSPYFLLRSAHKALEWLIRRYHIHQMNVEALLSCVFPYHETKMFVRVLQLLPLNDPTNKWHWLQPSAKSGVHLPRSSIVTHCRSDLGFLTFICDLVPNFIKVLGAKSSQMRTVVSLWACTVLGVIQDSSRVTERILGILVPSLVRGLKSRCVDHQAAAYMILAQLATITTLKSDFIVSVIPALAKRMMAQLSKEGLVCLALVVRSQNVCQLDKKTCKRICRIPGFVSLLSMLCEKYDMRQFLQVFLQWLLPQAIKSGPSISSSSDFSDNEMGFTGPICYASIMAGILTDVNLDMDQARESAKELLERLVELCDENVDEDKWRLPAVELLSPLQSRYAVPVDLAIDDITKGFQHKDPRRKLLQHVLSVAMGGAKGVLIDGSTRLLLSLNHAHATTRVLALSHLSDLLDKEKELPEGVTEESLISRLTDDDLSVVKAVLDMRKVLVRLVSHDKLVDALLLLVRRLNKNSASQALLGETVDFLCGEELADASERMEMALLPYLYVRQVHSNAFTTATFIMKSHMATRSTLLKDTYKRWIKASQKTGESGKQQCANLEKILIGGFSSALLQAQKPSLKKMLDDFVEGAKTCRTMRQVLLATASASLESVDDAAVAKDIASAVLNVAPIELSGDKGKGKDALLWKSLTAVVKVVARMADQLPSTNWWKVDSDFAHLLVMLLDILVTTRCGLTKSSHHSGQCEELIVCITKDILGPEKLVSVAALLLTFSLTEEPAPWRVSAVLQVAILHLVAREWQTAEGDRLLQLFNSSTCPALPWLLVCLASKHAAVRCGALGCIQTAVTVSGKNLKACTKLMKLVTAQEEEIKNDASHFENIIARTLKKNEELMDLVLYWVADATAPPSVRERLVMVLTSKPKEVLIRKLMPVGLELVKTCKEAGGSVVYTDIMKHLVVALRPEFAPVMSEDSAMFNFLITALNTSVTTSGTSLRQVVLKQVSQEFFHGLPSTKEQVALVAEILNVGVGPDSPEEANQVHVTLQQISLEWAHIKIELTQEDPTSKATTVKASRRTRATVLAEKTWQRLTILLEVLQRCKRFEEPEAVATALFTLLAKLEKKDGEEWEYRQGLILSLLHNITARWHKQQVKPSEGSVDVEGLVKVVRNPRLSRQTKQTAISVMANLAHFFPEYLLHHIMSIFTFVGTGLLAADDAHSLTMVTRTITSIVPAVLQSIHTKSQHSKDSIINQVIQVFVQSQRAIPRHRSLGVFTTVLETLGPEIALWRMLTLIVTQAVKTRKPQVETEEGPAELAKSPLDEDIEFAVNACEQFEAAVQVSAVTDVVRFLQGLTEMHTLGKGNPTRKKTTWTGSSVVDIKKLSSQEMRLLQFHLTKLVIQLLSNNTLVTQVVSCESGSSSPFSEFVKETVVYMLVVVRTHSVMGQPQVKFWKALLTKVYEVIDKVVYLLTTPALIEVVTSLLDHDLPGVRRKALELLASKMQSLQLVHLGDAERESLLGVLDRLIPIAVGSAHSGDADIAPIQQMALYDLKILCKLLGEAYPLKFIQVMKSVMEMIGTEEVLMSMGPPVVGSALLVVAEVVTSVRAHAIPYLGPITNPLLQLLANADYLSRHELLLTSGLTALHRLVTALPNFLSPYNRRIITIVCRLSVVDTTSDQRSQTAQRLTAIRHQMATVIASRVLIPALADSFSELNDSNELSQGALVSLMSIAKEHVTHISRVDLTAHQTPLLNFFCSALDFRTVDTQLSLSEVDAVENATIDAILSMVIRLSEDSFRPMFYKLYDWACREDSEELRKRRLTFFRLADSLAAKLRSLFNLFIGHALQAACQILMANNTLNGEVTYFGNDAESVKLSCVLVGHVLGCLTKCMGHDTDGIFTGDIFTMLLQPLVDQVENFVGGEELYEQRMTDNIVPCLSHFMVAAKEDSHQKALNYQVLLKTRNTSPKVRFGALKVAAGMAQQLGDDFVFLLPETIPFLAELMEDECEDVERECQQVVSQLEEVLGESLQKYF